MKDFSWSTDKQYIYTDWVDKTRKGAGAEETQVTKADLRKLRGNLDYIFG